MTWRVLKQDVSAMGGQEGYATVLQHADGRKQFGYYKQRLTPGKRFMGRFGPLRGADSAWMEDDYVAERHNRYRDGNKAVLLKL